MKNIQENTGKIYRKNIQGEYLGEKYIGKVYTKNIYGKYAGEIYIRIKKYIQD